MTPVYAALFEVCVLLCALRLLLCVAWVLLFELCVCRSRVSCVCCAVIVLNYDPCVCCCVTANLVLLYKINSTYMQISYPTCRSLSFVAHTNRLKPNNCRSPAIRHLNYIWCRREHRKTTIPQMGKVASGVEFLPRIICGS